MTTALRSTPNGFIDTGVATTPLSTSASEVAFDLDADPAAGEDLHTATRSQRGVLLDMLRQRWPLRLRHLEMAPEIQHRALAYAPTLADRRHQPIHEIRLSDAPALDRGVADVHASLC